MIRARSFAPVTAPLRKRYKNANVFKELTQG
jgi:hypothetical protein